MMDDSKGNVEIETMINKIVDGTQDEELNGGEVVEMTNHILENTHALIQENENSHLNGTTHGEDITRIENGEITDVNGTDSEMILERKKRLAKVEEKKLARAAEKKQKAEEEAARKIENDILFKRYRIEIKGYPKNVSLKEFKNLCQVTLQIPCYRIKTCYMGRDVIYASFRTPEDQAKAIVILEGYKYKGGILSVKECDFDFDLEEFEKIDFLHIPYSDVQELSLEDRVAKAVAPHSEKTYEIELAIKEKNEKVRMDKFSTEILEEHPELAKQLKYTKRMPRCKLDPIVPAPERTKYLNKCDFTIGMNKESDIPCIGYRVQGKEAGTVEVGPIHHLDIINDQTKLVVKLMEQYLSTSPHAPVNPFSKSGAWKKLIVKASSNGDLLLVVVVITADLSEEDVLSLKDGVVEFFSKGDGQQANVTSIYFQLHCLQKSVPSLPKPDTFRHVYDHVWGKPYTEETVLEKTYRISGEVMFTENTAAYQNLVQEVTKFVENHPADYLFDIGCGVGAMSIELANKFTNVFAIDHNSKAIEDASHNAKENNVENIKFYGKVDAAEVKGIFESIQGKKGIAIISSLEYLNGPSCSLLRNCKGLEHIICNWKITNYYRLFSKTRVGGIAAYSRHNFLPISAVPIDLAPQTKRSQTVILFKKYVEPQGMKLKKSAVMRPVRYPIREQNRRNWREARPRNYNSDREYYLANNYRNEALWQRGRSEFDQGYLLGLQAMAPGSQMRSMMDREFQNFSINPRSDYNYSRGSYGNSSSSYGGSGSNGYSSGNQMSADNSSSYSSRKRGLLDPPPSFQSQSSTGISSQYNYGSRVGGMGGYQDFSQPRWSGGTGTRESYNFMGRGVGNGFGRGLSDKRSRQGAN